MGTVISNLKARFGVDTSDFKRGLKDGEKVVEDFKGAAGDQVQQLANMFGVNMGAVGDAIGTAGKSLNFMGQSFRGAAKGGDIMAISMKFLRVALISTGIGAIVVALGSLVAYFQKSGEGADKFAKILAQVKSVINNVIDRLAIFGKGVYEIATGKFRQGWETMKGAFKGIGDEIKEDWKAAGDLADRLDALEDREIALITSLEERRAKAAELRLLAKEETEDQKKKLDYLNQAASLYKSVYADQVSVERERLAIMKEQLAISAKDPTDEQRKEVAEQEAKIASLMREQAEQLKALNRERRTADAAVKAELDLEVKKLATLQNALSTASTSNLKLPDFGQQLAGLQAPLQTMNDMFVDVAGAVNGAFELMANSVGEFIGALVIGDAQAGDFVKVIGGVFAELAITIGRIIIAAAIAKGALDKALTSFGGAGKALAAGIALVAIGTAVKGAMSKAAGAGGSAPAMAASSGGGVYDTRGTGISPAPIKLDITGKLTAEGKDLVYVMDQETNRKYLTT
jgi:hypothetical protein